MNPRELVNHIRSGPAKLVLRELLRFRRRTRSNLCDFNEFLQALQSSETIRTVDSGTRQQLGVAEDEWVLLVKTLGSIKGIQHLELYCTPGSRNFDPFQAVADAVNSAKSLCKLVIGLDGESFTRDPSGLTALANALREHTALEDFTWFDLGSRMETTQITALDPVFRAFPACPHLRKVTIMTKCASTDAVKYLLQLKPATDLRLLLETDQLLAVADEIRQGRCRIKHLRLSMIQGARSDATEAVKAVASAIRLDQNLEHISLRMENGFTDEAGMALAEALTVNKTMHELRLSVKPVHVSRNVQNKATLGAQAYEAFSSMVRVNTSLVLKLPTFETASADERLLKSRKQMRIEMRLNQVGRGRLLSSPRQTTREEYVDALHELNSYNVNSAFQVSCLYSLLLLNPAICMLRVDDTSDSGELKSR
jgi:hypothetical protein